MKHCDTPAGGYEFTLCGVAFDAFDTGDAEEPVVFAQAGELITCKECRNVIDHARAFKNYRVVTSAR